MARSACIAIHTAQKGVTNHTCMTGHPALSILADSACGMLSKLGFVQIKACEASYSGTRYTAAGKILRAKMARSTHIARHIAQKGITNHICMTGHPALSILADSACGMLSKLGFVQIKACEASYSGTRYTAAGKILRAKMARSTHIARHTAQKGITNHICMTGHPVLSILAGSACGMLSRRG